MKIQGQTIILDIGEEITIKTQNVEEPTEPEVITENILSFEQLLDEFNAVLLNTGHNRVTDDKEVYNYLQWEYNFANKEWNDNNSPYFDKNNMPEIFEFNGNNAEYYVITYNAMQAWLMASQLAEYVPTYGQYTNTQTELFKTAYRITEANEIPIYGNYNIHFDVNKVREAAAYICAYLHQEYDAEQIDRFREELNGEAINASSWEDLGYENTMLTDEFGRTGYEMNTLGYLINTQIFMPNAPGPRVPGTVVNELPFPYEEGEPEELFNLETGNYKMDETIHKYVIQNYNMMAQTPIEEWNSYSHEKKERIINAMATIPCTAMYMFGAPKKVSLVGVPIVNGYPRYIFEKDNNGEFTIEGPFTDLAGIFRYNAINKNELEQFISNVLEIADNSRFPTQDPNYGRCRPGCTCTRQGGEANPIHGSKENELYNISISCIVADTDEEKERWSQEDGFAADSPRSYVSGHSAQIVAMALILSQLNPDKTIDYMRKAHEYSVNRSIARFHWNSDCIQGRLFGTMIAPILRAMTGLQSGFDKVKQWIESPKPEGDWSAKIIIKNETGSSIDSTGEIRLYVDNHIGVNTYLPNAQSIGPAYTFEPGENEYDGINCILNGDDYMDDSYNESVINEIRIYDYRHWNNIDAGFNATLDIDDPRCDSTLKKSGGTYVIKLTNL